MKIIDIFETQKPRIFYRGTNPGDTRRISTGNTLWDSYLFVASNIRSATLLMVHLLNASMPSLMPIFYMKELKHLFR